SLETVIVVIHYSLAIVSISMTILLTIIAFRHTPSILSKFGLMLKFHALCDLYTAIGGSSEMLRLIPFGWSLVYLNYGPCSFIGPEACMIAGAMKFGGDVCSGLTIIASFVFRLMVVLGKMPTRNQTIGL
ncbi:hypothetical protein PMAYCL1PPCAC_08609, partial [Pristionchus mayeri]